MSGNMNHVSASAPAPFVHLYRDPVRFHADRRPTKVAIRDLTAGRDFTYAALDRRVDRLAGHLASIGIRAGDRVAVLAQNGPVFFEVQFAANRIGAVMVPLNVRLAVPELAFILSDSGAAVVVADAPYAETARQLAALPGASELQLMIADQTDAKGDYEAILAADGPAAVPYPATHDDPCMIIYTSGTTGRPKGAVITFGIMQWQYVNTTAICAITHRTVELILLPLFHIGGLNANANNTLRAGGTILLSRGFDPAAALWLLADPASGINNVTGVPAQYQFMTYEPEFAKADFSHLDYAGIGGAPTPVPVILQFAERNAPIYEGLGMTEAGPAIASIDMENALRKRGSVGKPVICVDLRIVGPDGQDVPPGEVGEMWLRGPNVIRSYWNNPPGSASAFVDGWFRSGDMARLDDEGFLFIVDRLKDMYISGGENVYPAEVERVLQQVPDIREVAVFGVPNARWGETGHAAVVLAPGSTLDAEQVIAICREALARYKLPSGVTFMEALPRNATGKIQKNVLREMFQNAGEA